MVQRDEANLLIAFLGHPQFPGDTHLPIRPLARAAHLSSSPLHGLSQLRRQLQVDRHRNREFLSFQLGADWLVLHNRFHGQAPQLTLPVSTAAAGR